ncbi:hypothetical protein [Streptomyces tateyamensis]
MVGNHVAQVAKLQQLRDLGVSQLVVYALHDAVESAIDAHGTSVITATS